MRTIDQPGVYESVTREAYNAIPGVNQSLLRHFRRTPAHVLAQMQQPALESDSMRLGNLIHAAILESDRFASRYVVMPDLSVGIARDDGTPYDNVKATKAYKAKLAAFGQANVGKIFVSAEDMAIVRGIQESIAKCRVATELLTNPGQNELAIVWTDDDTGLLCKALVDRLTTFEGLDVIVDLKTTDDARPEFWGKHCHDYGYALQAPFYRSGLKANGRPIYRFLHVIVETCPPYGVAVRELDDDSQEAGSEELRRYLDLYADCVESGNWPAYPDCVEACRLPRYAFGRDE